MPKSDAKREKNKRQKEGGRQLERKAGLPEQEERPLTQEERSTKRFT